MQNQLSRPVSSPHPLPRPSAPLTTRMRCRRQQDAAGWMQSPQQQGLACRAPDVPSGKCLSPGPVLVPRAAAVTGRAEVWPRFMPHIVTRPGPGVCGSRRPRSLSWPPGAGCAAGEQKISRGKIEKTPRQPGSCFRARELLFGLQERKDCRVTATQRPGPPSTLVQAAEQLPPIQPSPWPLTSSSSSCPAS